ncbi:uncharacterized protein LOC125672017 [Ostrea edulis]|uniref:uncharacterized protein LOC125672017 n=1 Tax=Ostrea edulis TaxID=37623 RepID=UPI0024AED5BF|nr:uncharacterized protein LOC125672017 [Ostrea edulis]
MMEIRHQTDEEKYRRQMYAAIDPNMDVFRFIIFLMKLSFLSLFSILLCLWTHNDVYVNPYCAYISYMLSFLVIYEAAPVVFSLILYMIKASKWARYLDYMNRILRSVFGYILYVIVQWLLRLLHRSFLLYVLWGVALSILCFIISDSFAAQYQQLFVSNVFYNDSFRKSEILPSNETNLLENKACIMTRTLDLSALMTDNSLIYRKDKFNCNSTDIDNTTMQNLRVEFKSPGEFAELHCSIDIPHASYLFGLKVEWKKDNRIIHADNQTIRIKTTSSNGDVKSSLVIPFIREEDYGIYMCQIKQEIQPHEYYIYRSKTIPFRLRSVIYTNLNSQQILKKFSGIQDVIFVPLGNKLQIVWYPLSFGVDRENITETYFINGENTTILKKKRGECHGCSSLTSVFCICGYLRDWFVLYMGCSLWDIVVNGPGYTQSAFSMCADTSVYGIHTIEYRRLVYDKEKKTLINVTVQHPDTVIVLPDHPYLTETDNSSKFEKVNKVMLQFMSGDLMKEQFQDASHGVSLITRYYLETIAFFVTPWVIYVFFINGNKIGSICPYTLELIRKPYRYTCYIFCCDEDKDDVTSQLYNKLLEDNINAGIILNNCEINNPGRNNFEITADIIDNSFCLIFFVTPAYLEDTHCRHYHLIPVMENIKTGTIFSKNVLCIMNENAVFPKDISLNLATVSKVKWETSNYSQTYRTVKHWLPNEIFRFSGTSFIESFSLSARKKIC